MGNTSRAGFTILETVLFLAVTGLLVLVMVAGAGASINIQRYRDSTESFKALLQEQYADLGSVQNGRASDRVCGSTARPVTIANGEAPGQSDCMIVGRYLRIEGQAIGIYDVLAYENARPLVVGANDISIMRGADYTYNTAATPNDRTSLEWQTKIAWPQAGYEGPETVENTATRGLAILIIRSPYTGQVYTFTSNHLPAEDSIDSGELKAMMQSAAAVPGRAERIVCIASDGLFASDDQSIYIAANANSPSAIEVRSNSLLPGGARC